MTDEPQKRLEVDYDKLLARFMERGVNGNCPMCHTMGWTVQMPLGSAGVSLPWGNGRGDYYMLGMRVVPVTCNRCGFVRMHDIAVIGDDVLKEQE